MLSVVVPVYNAEKYLRQCIESILNQSMQDIELILVDDGSADRSIDICSEYQKKDKRVKIINAMHKGAYNARRLGVLNAVGDYITFVDSDDFISEYSYIMATDDMRSAVDIISFDIYRYFDEDNIKYDCDEIPEKIYNRQEICEEIFPIMIWDEKSNRYGIDPALWNKIFKSEILKQIYSKNHEIDFHYGEDIAVVYPVILKASYYCVHHKAYYYHRQRPGNTVPSYFLDEKYPLKLDKLYCFLSEQMSNNPIFQRQIDLFYAYSAQFIKLKYGISITPSDMIFPFDKVNKNDDVVIYGAGNVGKLFIRQTSLLDYCNIILWVDQNYKELSGVSDPEDILKIHYDRIVIAISDENIRNKVKEFLIGNGVNKDAII